MNLKSLTASSSDIPQLNFQAALVWFSQYISIYWHPPLYLRMYGANNENHNHNHTNNQNNKRRKIDKSDISHMLTVLRSVKTQLDEMNSTSNHAKAEGRSSQILRLQYQMLLTHLASMQVEKELVLPHVKSEHRSEERRSDYLRKIAHKAMQKGGMEMEVEDSDRVTGRRVSLQATRDGANRLEQIKRGAIQSQSQSSQSQSLPSHDQNSTDAVNIMSTSSTASFGFGKQALNDRNAHRKRSSKKMSMMGMKRKLVEENGETWIDPEVLFQKRQERLERTEEKTKRKTAAWVYTWRMRRRLRRNRRWNRRMWVVNMNI
mmetsp:Transcript_8143/g.12170  ORF Transcript_8143/g.12170 Transcript_8143/m.12170 type:complete len:318 (+) Transcript_8143:230-1183(+)